MENLYILFVWTHGSTIVRYHC